jgi:phosphoribosylaminoimidazole (AIR) synthetase
MGIGMVIVTSADQAKSVREHFDSRGDAYYDIGRVVEGRGLVSIVE